MAASYDIYLDSEDAGSSGIDPKVLLATKKALFHWLLASIEPAESTRFVSMISKFENGVKTTTPSPYLLWKTIRDYHISNSESVKLMLRSEITDLSQGSTKDLLEYIDIFRSKVDAYLGSNGEMSEEEQARQFVRSLNREWAEKGCDLLDAGHVKFRALETELKKTYQTRKMFTSNRQQSSRAAESTEASHSRRNGRWQTCNKNKCLGRDHPTKPHDQSECFHHPRNATKMEDWKRSKREAGEWVEYPRGNRGGGSRGRGRGGSNMAIGFMSHQYFNNQNFPNSNDISSALENMRLEDRDISYHVEIDGKFSCSAEPQISFHGDQCNTIALIDTGASHHMFHDLSLFDPDSIYKNDDPSAKLSLAGGGATLEIHSMGRVNLLNSKGELVKLADCLYVPQLSRNLIAGGRILRAGAVTTVLKDPNFRIDHRKKELFVGQFVGEGCMMYVRLQPSAIRAGNI